ncbi:LacI family DNA-binding transcriptional regulator [Halobacillus sp. Marseille-Q1614]|uniref:LacI family DNA-binding transcriptional regulator n=1 Tax=Halobacillus sp. Marseille-Q1614 TaxID=2709134 RepID=UPI001570C187|nr:LacI family DNA-binding transcriptional regulator [Halobacillus sp. Marseille-Q1614]
MGVTIKDIAKTAGVSYSTVSKALRDSPLVKEPTKKRIIEIANQLGYRPNAAARSLVSKRSHTIGVVWPTIERVTHSALITGLNKQLEKHSYTTLISINDMQSAIDTFNRYQVDAIVAFDDKNSREPVESTVPIVTYGIASHSSCPTVDVNRKQAIMKAVDYLASIGHQKIGYIGAMEEDHLQKEKVDGFTEAINHHTQDPSACPVISVSDLEQYNGYVAMRNFFDQPNRPTAIINGSHDLSRGCLRAIQEHGFSVPEDFSVISYDNIPSTETLEVPLSTVGVPINTITKILTDTLISVIQEENIEEAIYLDPELNITSSCRPISKETER